MSADLTVSEAERLDACEQVIERGLATFVDVGMALLEVTVREHGTVERAAVALGVSKQSIYGWMQRHGYKVERRIARNVRAS